MKVFLSWSGNRSRLIAEALRNWLNDTIPYLEPWMSSEDIAKGARWSIDLFSELEGTSVGIVCLTPENINAPWILFESGAVGKALDKSRVCTYLYDLKPADLEGPLVQFQATMANKTDTLKLLQSLNKELPDDQKRGEEQIKRAFDKWWPDLEKAIDNLPAIESDPKLIRPDRELLEEIIDLVRTQTGQLHFTEKEIKRPDRMSFNNLFDGIDILKLVAKSKLDGNEDDQNATDWTNGTNKKKALSIEGDWLSRWYGGAAGGNWREGSSKILETGGYVLVWYIENASKEFPYPFMIIAKRGGKNRLIGRYVNLRYLDDSSPWVGLIVDNRRIDGQWELGRWDFRR